MEYSNGVDFDFKDNNHNGSAGCFCCKCCNGKWLGVFPCFAVLVHPRTLGSYVYLQNIRVNPRYNQLWIALKRKESSEVGRQKLHVCE